MEFCLPILSVIKASLSSKTEIFCCISSIFTLPSTILLLASSKSF